MQRYEPTDTDVALEVMFRSTADLTREEIDNTIKLVFFIKMLRKLQVIT